MDAAYVKSVTGTALVEGLTSVVTHQPVSLSPPARSSPHVPGCLSRPRASSALRPANHSARPAFLRPAKQEDSVDFLGKFLIHYADHLDTVKGAKLDAEAVAAAAAAAAARAPAAGSGAGAQAGGFLVSASAEAKVKAAMEAAGASGVPLSAAQLDAFCAQVCALVGASSLYLAERTGAPTPAGEEVPPGGGARIRYLAVSGADQEFVRAAVVAEPAGSVTLKTWVMPEAPPVEEPVEGEEAKPAPPPPELPVAHVENVLRDQALVFHGVPRPGSYLAAPLQFNSVLHAAALAEGAAPTTAEDGTVSPPAPTPVVRSLALCCDTMGSAPGAGAASGGGGARFSPAQVACLKRCAGYLKAALEASEAKAFVGEYATFLAPRPAEEEAAALAALASEAEAAATAGAEQGAAEADAAGETAPEDVKALIKGRALLGAAKRVLQSRLPTLPAQVSARLIPPKESALKLLTAVWYMLGYTKEQLADAGQPDALALSWPVARSRLDHDFVARIASYDAEAVAVVLAYAKAETLKAELAGLDTSELNKVSGALGAMHAWAKCCIEVKEAANAKRAREAAEAAAKLEAEKEAAAAAAAAAAGGE
jgi:hypothetical protein